MTWTFIVSMAAVCAGALGFAGSALLEARARRVAEVALANASKDRDHATEDFKNAAARADAEKKRADALDHLLAEAAVAGPVDGSYDRLMHAWKTGRAPDAAVAVVPVAGDAAKPPGDADALMRPGD